MISKLMIKDASGWTIFIFGLLALLFGFVSLLRPELLLSTLGFNVLDRASRGAGDYTLVFATASAMASFNVGAWELAGAVATGLALWQENKKTGGQYALSMD